MDGPGELAGVKAGWIIAAVNGLKTSNKLEVVHVITSSPGGAALEFEFDVPVAEPADEPAAAAEPAAAEAGPPPAVPAFLGAVPNLPAKMPGAGSAPSSEAAPLPSGLSRAIPVVAPRPQQGQGGTLVGAPVDEDDGLSDGDMDSDMDGEALELLGQMDDLDFSSSGSEEEDMAAATESGLTPSPRVSDGPSVPSDYGLTRLPPEEGGTAGTEAGLHTLAELTGYSTVVFKELLVLL